MTAAQKLREIIAENLNFSLSREEMAEDVVRALLFNSPGFLISDREVFEVIEISFVDGIDGELAWNVYTKENDV